MQRSFNLEAYQQCDGTAKQASISLMKKRGYELVGDPDKEHYKKFDLQFKHSITGEVISVENEYRTVFHTIKLSYDTIHIPIRKKNTKSDFYLVWGPAYTDVAIIKTTDIQKFKDELVDVYCDSELNKDTDPYIEQFLDIPKKYAQFYTKNKKGCWKLDNPKI